MLRRWRKKSYKYISIDFDILIIEMYKVYLLFSVKINSVPFDFLFF